MGRQAPHITAAELRIMKVLWRLGRATVRECLETLGSEGGEEPAYTTVMTMMGQLAEKGALKVDRTRQPFVYRPAVPRDRILGQRVTEFLRTVFDGSTEDLLLHLAEQAELSIEDLQRIEAKIQARQRTTPARRARRKEPTRDADERADRGAESRQ